MTEVQDRLSAALAARYALEKELGRGGMATVYLAHDFRHDRPVALKVLHPELAHALGAQRFLLEIKTAARLQHPHILSVHDSGEAAGLLWFTMPYVEGETLRKRLERERQLPLEDALRIAREAALALDCAHRHGVIHRDVKPENILLCEGQALVADFGIGRALGLPAPGERLTDTGLIVGTPTYMSPEQASGQAHLDGRSDVYSLGCVLYEMLIGEPPYTGASPQAIVAKRFMHPAPPLRQLRPAVPVALEQAVTKALAQMPADRFATGAEFARALDAAGREAEPPAKAPPPASSARGARPLSGRRVPVSLALAFGFLLGLGVLFGWLRHHGGDDAGGAGSKRLAVLPFENLGAPEDQYFAEGVADEIRGKLAALPGLQVTARSSSSQYRKTTKSLREVGRELGVDYLLTGTVQWQKGAAGNRVRVSPELIQVSTASTRWQQPFEAALTDVFQVQADVAARAAEALNVALGAGERRALAGQPTRNLSAYDAYLKGNELFGSGVNSTAIVPMRRAVEWYERAVTLDSMFALAWARLSRARTALYFGGIALGQADLPKAEAAAQRALRLAPGLPEGHLALGDYYGFGLADWRRAEAAYAQARALAPRDADALTGVAHAERSSGRWEASLAHLREAAALDPRSRANARWVALTLLWLRWYPEAHAAADRFLALAPDDADAYEHKAMVHLAQGDLPAARALVGAATRRVEPTALAVFFANYWDLFWALDEAEQEVLLRASPAAFGEDTLGWGLSLAGMWAVRGDTTRARAYADSARVAGEARLKGAPDDAQLHTLLGVAHAYLGRSADAVREGQRGVALTPPTRDALVGTYLQHQLARIHILLADYDRAVNELALVLTVPYYLSPGWLRIDPAFTPLRGHPGFRRLLAGDVGSSKATGSTR